MSLGGKSHPKCTAFTTAFSSSQEFRVLVQPWTSPFWGEFSLASLPPVMWQRLHPREGWRLQIFLYFDIITILPLLRHKAKTFLSAVLFSSHFPVPWLVILWVACFFNMAEILRFKEVMQLSLNMYPQCVSIDARHLNFAYKFHFNFLFSFYANFIQIWFYTFVPHTNGNDNKKLLLRENNVRNVSLNAADHTIPQVPCQAA